METPLAAKLSVPVIMVPFLTSSIRKLDEGQIFLVDTSYLNKPPKVERYTLKHHGIRQYMVQGKIKFLSKKGT